MTDKSSGTPSGSEEERRQRRRESPQRTPGGDPDTLEGPGGRNEAKREEDARDEVTRRGER